MHRNRNLRTLKWQTNKQIRAILHQKRKQSDDQCDAETNHRKRIEKWKTKYKTSNWRQRKNIATTVTKKKYVWTRKKRIKIKINKIDKTQTICIYASGNIEEMYTWWAHWHYDNQHGFLMIFICSVCLALFFTLMHTTVYFSGSPFTSHSTTFHIFIHT